jgi:UDP-2,3-diacylglucosamine pyrophosphatase LpxH
MSEPVDQQNTQYLILSDVHLGSDLVQHARPWTTERLSRVLEVDYNLASMLDHYSNNAGPDWKWTLVIAGDLVDFIGMSISADEAIELQTPLSEEEMEHGLGSAADHAVHKIHAVARRHPLVFSKLAQFVAAGHRLVLVRGNHDVDFYWEPVRRAFIDELRAHADLVDDPVAHSLFESRIEFRQWFYYVKGQLYVEHGHQYDETCAYHNGLAPLSPYDPRRLAYSFSDILMRYIVRPTRGFSTEGHEKKNLPHYLRLAFSLGFVGCARLFFRFVRAVIRMFKSWRDHFGNRASKARSEQEKRLQQIAQRVLISVDKLRRLSSLWATPVTARISSIMRSVFLDVILSTIALVLILIALAVFQIGPFWLIPLVGTLGAIGIAIWIKISRVFDPKEAVKESARRVAKLLPARFIVMGHTHEPVMEPIDENTTYINLGNWTGDNLDDNAPKAPCSHLVIRHVEGQLKAEFVSIWPKAPVGEKSDYSRNRPAA